MSEPASSIPAINVANLRHEYATRGLRRADLDADPIKQFASWFADAAGAKIRDANAMSLATVTADGKPAVRIVLLKGFDERGFVFFTNYASEKGRQLEQNPHAALAFYWVQFERQVRVTGSVEKAAREESESYFHARPVGSQLGAWASSQSETITDRSILETRLENATARFVGVEVPPPPNWGGFRLRPETIEFWQGRPNRLHDRFLYQRQADDSWQIDRLAP